MILTVREDQAMYEKELSELQARLETMGVADADGRRDVEGNILLTKLRVEATIALRRYLIVKAVDPADKQGHNVAKASWQAAEAAVQAALPALPRQPADADDGVYFDYVQYKASDQTADLRGKMGPTAMATSYFDPTPDGRLYAALVPTPADYDAHDGKLPEIGKRFLMKLDMKAVAEEDVGAKKAVADVDETFGGDLSNLYNNVDEHVEVQPTLQMLNMPAVIASAGSAPDCVGGVLVKRTFVPLRVREYKKEVFHGVQQWSSSGAGSGYQRRRRIARPQDPGGQGDCSCGRDYRQVDAVWSRLHCRWFFASLLDFV